MKSQLDSLDFGDSSSVLSNTGKDFDLDKLKAIKRPEDIAQIKDWKDKCGEEHGQDTVREIEVANGVVGLATFLLLFKKISYWQLINHC